MIDFLVRRDGIAWTATSGFLPELSQDAPLASERNERMTNRPSGARGESPRHRPGCGIGQRFIAG